MNLALLLAHQGGWDEIVLLVGPLVVITVLIIASRRGRDSDEADADRPVNEPES